MSDSSTAILSAAARFQRDLYLYLRAAREMEGLPLTTRGYVSRPALRRVRALLQAADGHALAESDADLAEVDDGRLFFLRRLLERLGLLTKDEAAERATQRLVVAPSDQIAAYFARSLAERLRICARVWVAGGWWPDAPDTRAAVPGVMTPAAPRIALDAPPPDRVARHDAAGRDRNHPRRDDAWTTCAEISRRSHAPHDPNA